MAVERDPGVGQFSNLCNGVVSIAITLLVLPLTAIDVDPYDGDLARLFVDNRVSFAVFLVSFWVIATFWLAHFHVFRRLTRVDYGILALTLLWLLVIAFIPFPTYLLGAETLSVADGTGLERQPLAFYIVVALIGWVLQTLTLLHAMRAGLLHYGSDADAAKVARVQRRNVVITVLVAALLVVSLAAPRPASALLILLIFALPVAWLVEWAIGRLRTAAAGA